VIPQEILATLKLRAGDLVAFSEQKNGVVRYRVELSTEAQKQLFPFSARRAGTNRARHRRA
jgi:hypothetical protein